MKATKFLGKLLAVAMLIAALSPMALAEDLAEIPTDENEQTAWTTAEPALQDTEMVMLSDDAGLSEEASDEVIMAYDAPMDASSALSAELQQLVGMSDQIRTALLSGATQIDLSSLKALGITTSNQQFKHIAYYCPYIDGSHISATVYYYNDGTYAYMKLSNNLSAAATKTWVNTIDSKLDTLVNLMDSSLSVAEQALVLHDYMDAHYHYDTSYSNYFPGLLLAQNTGVCQSYSFLFQYLMNRKGIECYTTTSSSMNHAWNILKVGDSYYHIDIAWDDPLDDRYGEAQHNYFLVSDATMQDSNHNHYGWDLSQYSCRDSSYEDDYFVNAASPVVVDGSNRYYTDNAAVECYNVRTGATTAIVSMNGWGRHSGLFEDHGKLFFNTTNAIMSYDLTSGATATYTTINTANGNVYGALLEGSTISYAQQTSNNVAYASKNIGSVSYNSTHVYRNGTCCYCGKADECAQAVTLTAGSTAMFSDVSASAYYYQPIAWAAGKGIATAISGNCFRPDDNCTREQAVTFIWRAAGRPQVPAGTVNPFSDISSSDACYEAVLWAYASKIVNGIDSTHFGPDETCTRAQIITFIDRWANNATAAKGTANPFSDVASSAYYYNPVLWGVSQHIVNGTSDTTFSPDDLCTRAQIITFIYRYASAQ